MFVCMSYVCVEMLKDKYCSRHTEKIATTAAQKCKQSENGFVFLVLILNTYK